MSINFMLYNNTDLCFGLFLFFAFYTEGGVFFPYFSIISFSKRDSLLSRRIR